MIEATATTLPSQQVQWIVRVAKGYIKLAVLLAKKIAQGTINVVDLTQTYEIGLFLKGLFPSSRLRQAMKGLALLIRVGWDGDVSTEGKCIAEFLGIPWAEMRNIIGEAERDGLVSKQGNYRYVTPEILAHWLAVDEWQTRGQDISLHLRRDLPAPESRRALMERFMQLVGIDESIPIINVSSVVESFLSASNLFPDLETLNDEYMAQLFFYLAKRYLQAALEILDQVISSASLEQLLNFTQRRYVLPILERLAWRKETFTRAAQLIIRLAETENETWGNNATGVWSGLFLSYTGATETPAIDRYPLLRLALRHPSAATRRLAVDALAKALTVIEVGNAVEDFRDGYILPPRWHPTTREEDQEVRREALHLLEKAFCDSDEQVQSQAKETFFSHARGLVSHGLPVDVVDCFTKVEVLDDNLRRQAWEQVQLILKHDKAFLSDEQCQQLLACAERFWGRSFHDRIHRYVGRATVVDFLEAQQFPENQRAPALIARLAEEGMESPTALRKELPWLMSREAENAWHFGFRLGQLDTAHSWLKELVIIAQASHESLLLSAYLQGRANGGESDWRENLLDEWLQDPAYASLIFEAIRTAEANKRAVERLILLVDREWLLPKTIGGLVYGGWIRDLEASQVAVLLERLARDESSSASEAGLALLSQWIEIHDQEMAEPLIPMAWLFIERSGKTSTPMLTFYWNQVGSVLLREDPPRIIRTLFQGAGASLTFDDERFLLFREAFTLQPGEAWKVFAEHLLEYENISHALRTWFRESSILDMLPTETLLEWARQEPGIRPQLLAKLTKPKEAITPLIRGLLKEYGIDNLCADILAANFRTGMWSGTSLQHEKDQLKIIEGWFSDPEANVQKWAQRMAEAARHFLPQAERWDKENGL